MPSLANSIADAKASLNVSVPGAARLHKKIRSGYSDVKNLGVKQGPFYVLVGASMPSILVETAFLSNATEESRLKDPAYQNSAAEGIYEGVRNYISSLK